MAVPVPRARGLALAFLGCASPAVLGAALGRGAWAEWGFALLTVAFPVALMALGAVRRGRLALRAARALVALLLVLEGTALALLWLRPEAGGLEIAGFPLAAVAQVVGLWILPLPLATLAYALSFEATAVTRDDLEALRARAGGARRPPAA